MTALILSVALAAGGTFATKLPIAPAGLTGAVAGDMCWPDDIMASFGGTCSSYDCEIVWDTSGTDVWRLTCVDSAVDAAASNISFEGPSTNPASTSNTDGGHLMLIPGSGTQAITIADHTQCAGELFTGYVALAPGNGHVIGCTEGIQWAAGGTNDAAATSLAACLDAYDGITVTAVAAAITVVVDDGGFVQLLRNWSGCSSMIYGNPGAVLLPNRGKLAWDSSDVTNYIIGDDADDSITIFAAGDAVTKFTAYNVDFGGSWLWNWASLKNESPTGDTDPTNPLIAPANAGAYATGGNRNGGNLRVAVGGGAVTITIDDWNNCAGESVTLQTANAGNAIAPLVFTEGVDWTAATSDTATAASLLDAIDNHGAMSDSASALGVISLVVTPGYHISSATESEATCTTIAKGDSGIISIGDGVHLGWGDGGEYIACDNTTATCSVGADWDVQDNDILNPSVIRQGAQTSDAAADVLACEAGNAYYKATVNIDGAANLQCGGIATQSMAVVQATAVGSTITITTVDKDGTYTSTTLTFVAGAPGPLEIQCVTSDAVCAAAIVADLATRGLGVTAEAVAAQVYLIPSTTLCSMLLSSLDGTGTKFVLTSGTNGYVLIPSSGIVFVDESVPGSQASFEYQTFRPTIVDNGSNVMGFRQGNRVYVYEPLELQIATDDIRGINSTRMSFIADGQRRQCNAAETQCFTLGASAADTATLWDKAGTGAGHLVVTGQTSHTLNTVTCATATDDFDIDWNGGNAVLFDMEGCDQDANDVNAPTNPVDSSVYKIVIEQSTAGTEDLTWNAAFLWPGGTDPVLTQANNARDMIECVYADSVYHCTFAQAFAP